MADLLQLDRSYYSRMERGARQPSLALFLRVANALTLSPTEALTLGRELAGLPATDTPPADAGQLAGLPLHLDGQPVELLELFPAGDGWTATVRPAGRPDATARRVPIAGLTLLPLPTARAA